MKLQLFDFILLYYFIHTILNIHLSQFVAQLGYMFAKRMTFGCSRKQSYPQGHNSRSTVNTFPALYSLSQKSQNSFYGCVDKV
jgi:hypothetical protein